MKTRKQSSIIAVAKIGARLFFDCRFSSIANVSGVSPCQRLAPECDGRACIHASFVPRSTRFSYWRLFLVVRSGRWWKWSRDRWSKHDWHALGLTRSTGCKRVATNASVHAFFIMHGSLIPRLARCIDWILLTLSIATIDSNTWLTD